MRSVYYLLALVGIMVGLVLFAHTEKAHAGGPWIDQYCDVETTQVRVVDSDGNILESKVEEKVVCNDGAAVCITTLLPMDGSISLGFFSAPRLG